MKTTTWKRDSHGLFDYESPAVEKCDLVIYSDSVLARSFHGEVKAFGPGEEICPEFVPLLKVTEIDASNKLRFA